jgi:phosphatidylserine/phosphatidylglycerophosphate/cardiolipin synthase-like enzyme
MIAKTLKTIPLTIFLFFPAIGQCYSGIELLINDPLLFERPQSATQSEVGIALLNLLNGAKDTIDFAIFGLRDQDDILNALINAKKRGVSIRGVVDKDTDNQNYYTSTSDLLKVFPDIETDYEQDLMTLKYQSDFDYNPYCTRPYGFEGYLQCIGYSLSTDECIVASHASREPIIFRGDIMHNKFFIVDGESVWTGSTNASDSGTGGYNANTAVVVRSKEIALWFTAEFDQMYVQGRYHRAKPDESLVKRKCKLDDGSTVHVSFSPQGDTIEKLVRPLIKNAKEYIDVSIFFLTHKKLAGDLIKAHQDGVKVRVIIDATSAKNGYTKHEILRAAGIPVKVENWGGKMHMKVAAIDDKYLITGSMNWTSAGEGSNDENTLIIKNPKYTMQMHQFFDYLWNSIPDRWLKNRPDPESLDSSTACFDGADNDFDGLADSDDPGCSETPPELSELPPYWIVRKIDGNNLIKGNISKGKGFFAKDRKIYQIPGSRYYEKTIIDTQQGERWFCSLYDAC